MDDSESISYRTSVLDHPPLTLSPEDETRALAAAVLDPEAFTPLYRSAVRPIYRYLYSRLGNAHEAEDLTSQVFIEAIESLPRYRHRGRFLGWLFSIARHRWINHLRNRKVEAPLEDAETLLAGANLPADLVEAEEIRRLTALLGELNDDERELLRLRYAAELGFSQIADILNRSEDAVKKQHYRLLARLQRSLEVKHE